MAECGPEEDVLLLPILITCEELLLLSMEEPDHIPLPQRKKRGRKKMGEVEGK